MEDMEDKEFWELLEEINNFDDSPVMTGADEEFADDFFDLIQGIIDEEESITEAFTDTANFENHLAKHRMNGENKRSSNSTVYYDFNSVVQYRAYEKELCAKRDTELSMDTVARPGTIYDTEALIFEFRKLLEGDYSIYLGPNFGFRNSHGITTVYFHSFADNVTNNYPGHTIDCLIANKIDKTVTLFPIAASRFAKSFNKMVEKFYDNRKPKPDPIDPEKLIWVSDLKD